MDKLLSEVTNYKSMQRHYKADNNDMYHIIFCNCIKIFFHINTDTDDPIKYILQCRLHSIKICADLNFDLDVNCIVVIEENVKINASIKCYTLCAFYVIQNILDCNAIDAVKLDISEHDYEFLADDNIVIDSIMVLDIFSHKIDPNTLREIFPNCILIIPDEKMNKRTINKLTKVGFIVYADCNKYYMSKENYKTIPALSILKYKYPMEICFNVINNYIKWNIEQKIEMYKNANFYA
jgi:hypothetical protein